MGLPAYIVMEIRYVLRSSLYSMLNLQGVNGCGTTNNEETCNSEVKFCEVILKSGKTPHKRGCAEKSKTNVFKILTF